MSASRILNGGGMAPLGAARMGYFQVRAYSPLAAIVRVHTTA